MDSEQDLIRRAMAAHLRGGGTPGDIRGHAHTRGDGKTHVALTQGGRTVAVYRVRNDGKLKRLRRWPVELREGA